jgi:osmotically-inducible protein OsmY
MEVLQVQTQNRQQQQREAVKDKARELEERKRYEVQLGWAQMTEKQEKVSNQMRYQQELSSQVHEKKLRDSIDTDLLGRSAVKQRHNPITNPLEFHIDNPYLLRQMQQRRPR